MVENGSVGWRSAVVQAVVLRQVEAGRRWHAWRALRWRSEWEGKLADRVNYRLVGRCLAAVAVWRAWRRLGLQPLSCVPRLRCVLEKRRRWLCQVAWARWCWRSGIVQLLLDRLERGELGVEHELTGSSLTRCGRAAFVV